MITVFFHFNAVSYTHLMIFPLSRTLNTIPSIQTMR